MTLNDISINSRLLIGKLSFAVENNRLKIIEGRGIDRYWRKKKMVGNTSTERKC